MAGRPFRFALELPRVLSRDRVRDTVPPTPSSVSAVRRFSIAMSDMMNLSGRAFGTAGRSRSRHSRIRHPSRCDENDGSGFRVQIRSFKSLSWYSEHRSARRADDASGGGIIERPPEGAERADTHDDEVGADF